jgi:hypothetical protein
VLAPVPLENLSLAVQDQSHRPACRYDRKGLERRVHGKQPTIPPNARPTHAGAHRIRKYIPTAIVCNGLQQRDRIAIEHQAHIAAG